MVHIGAQNIRREEAYSKEQNAGIQLSYCIYDITLNFR